MNKSRDLKIAPTAFFKWLVGRGSLSGSTIAFVIHSVDHSLATRLISYRGYFENGRCAVRTLQMNYICCVILGKHAIMNPRHRQDQPNFFTEYT